LLAGGKSEHHRVRFANANLKNQKSNLKNFEILDLRFEFSANEVSALEAVANSHAFP